MTKSNQKIRTGEVVSDKMDKTVVVRIDSVKTHPIYKKKYVTSQKFKAHDEKNEYKTGEIVEIVETKPISKDKNFSVLKKVK
ncbi:MAG: 30S ribosomal protein S17 [Patescibacteria group bacterium]